MINKNISDKFFEAVENYNRTITDPKKEKLKNISYDERKGIFFNCLRRAFGWMISSVHSYWALRVDDISCIFEADGTVETVSIIKYIPTYINGWEQDEKRYNILEIKDLCNKLPKIYPTKVLNEMALIVNSIN